MKLSTAQETTIHTGDSLNTAAYDLGYSTLEYLYTLFLTFLDKTVNLYGITYVKLGYFFL